MLKLALLAFTLTIFSAHAVHKPKRTDQSWVTIGDNPARCLPEFKAKNPTWSTAAEAAREATLEIDCPGFRAGAIYIETKSRRVILTAEHSVTPPKLDQAGIRVLAFHTDPRKCVVIDPETRHRYALDPKIKPHLGHPLTQVNKTQIDDWMLLALKEPIKSRHPLPLGRMGEFDPNEPIVATGLLGLIGDDGQRCFNAVVCHSRYTWYNRDHEAGHLNTDCSSGFGNCGGAAVALDRAGQPVLVGMDYGGTANMKDGLPWDKAENYEGYVTPAGPLATEIKNIEDDLDPSLKTF